MEDTTLRRDLGDTMRPRFLLACFTLMLFAVMLVLTLGTQQTRMAALSIGSIYGLAIQVLLSILIFGHFWVLLAAHILGTFYRNARQAGAAEQANSIAWCKNYFVSKRWIDMIVSYAALTVVLGCFTAFKSTVVGVQGYAYDAAFIAWDRTIFFGHDAWQVTHSIFRTPWATSWIDTLYHGTFLPMLFGYIFRLALQGHRSLRYTYMASYLATVVTIGMILAASMASAGPLFDGTLFGDGQSFARLSDRLRDQHNAGAALTSYPISSYLLQLHQEGSTKIGAGISAMPSMHMAWTFLWVFPSWHISRTLGAVMVIYAGVIWVGSVHLGWHYFVDGLVSLVVTGVIWLIAGRAMGLYGPRQVIRATT